MRAVARTPKAGQRTAFLRQTAPARVHSGGGGGFPLQRMIGNQATLRRMEADREKAAGASGLCPECEKDRKTGFQAKLVIGEAGDAFEREADRLADQVTASPAHAAAAGGVPPRVQRVAAQSPARSDAAAPASVGQVLAGSGAPLEATARQDMEQRFGHDFSAVRVHADAAAGRSALDVGARAYTVGSHVVFAPGEYAPGQAPGRHLLAHELAHVLQQNAGVPLVQRGPPTGKIDVSIVLTDEKQDMAEGRFYSGTVIRVFSAEDAAAKLKALGAPIGTLYVISHSSAAGKVQFSSAEGIVSWLAVGDLGKKLKGATAIDNVDFRGCSLGNTPGALQTFRTEVGAQTAIASNCFTFSQVAQPLEAAGVPVTSPDQIAAKDKAAYDQAMIRKIATLVSADGKPVKDCLEGLPKGQKATLANVWKLYWANKGNLLARWASPDYNYNWQEDSICTKDMTEDNTKPCYKVVAK